MNDVSIFVWNLIIVFFDFVLGFFIAYYSDLSFDKFYERVRSCTRLFFFNLILFAITIKRAFSYTSYIFYVTNSENISGWKFLNAFISWIPFVATICIFLWSLYCFVDLFSYHSYCHDDDKVFCSIKTIKLISTFSCIEYNNSRFYYESKNGKKIYLCFNPIVYIVLCFWAHRSDKRLCKTVQRKENREKEQNLYETLINDLEKIKKENEAEAGKYFKKAKETLENINK